MRGYYDLAIQEQMDPKLGRFIVISAYEVSCDDIVRIGRFLGVIK